jgi:outer membrane receptor protein involved in Fe transport
MLKRIMKIFIFLFLFFWCGLLQAQNVLSGYAFFENGTPATQVTIDVKGSQKSTQTDSKGYFKLTGLPEGTIHLSFRSLEIIPHTLAVQQENRHALLRVMLESSHRKELQEVKIVAQSEKRKIESSGFAAHVIDMKEVSQRNLTTNELLDRTVGVRVRQNGGLGADVTYNLNGMSGNSVGIFVDGLAISTYGASFSINNIPPSMIERVEIYKGVLPAHLSGDLLGGAINIVLKKGVGLHNSLNASVSYGSFHTVQSDLSGQFRNSKTGFTLRGSVFQSYTDNNYDIWGRFVRNETPEGRMEPIRVKRFNDAYRSIGGRAEVGFTEVLWADQLLIGYNGSDVYNEIQHGQYMTRPYKGRFTASQAHVLSLHYSKSNLFIPGLQFQVNGVYSHRSQYIQDTVTTNYTWEGIPHLGRRFNNDGTVSLFPTRSPYGAQQGPATMMDIQRQIINVRSNVQYQWDPQHKLILNHVFYTADRQDDDALRTVMEMAYRATSDLSKQVWSLAYEFNAWDSRLKSTVFAKHYQQDIRRIHPFQSTVNGMPTRIVDTIENTKYALGYGLALSYGITSKLMAVASAERAVRMPSDGEIFGGPAENVTANPLLQPEVSDNVNMGVKWREVETDQLHHWQAGLSGFIRNTHDQIMQRTDDRLNEATQTSPFVNLGHTQAIGFEVEGSYHFASTFHFQMNASRFNALFKMPGTVHYNKQVPNQPYFTFNSSAQYQLDNAFQKRSRLQFFYQLGNVHPFNITWEEVSYSQTPTQWIQDVGMSYRFPNSKFLISFDVKNITDRPAFDNFAVQKPGRAFYFKLNYTLSKF